MFRKICNYAAILSLSLVFTNSAVFANYPLLNTKKTKSVKVAENKRFSRYSTNIPNNEYHSYSVRAGSGKKSTVTIRTPLGVSVKIKTPSGEIKTYSENRFYRIELLSAGDYTIELSSNTVTSYSLEVLNRNV